MVHPGPSSLFVFLDEHPSSINDGGFAVAIKTNATAQGLVVDVPANYHNGASSFCFADGHSEMHRWTESGFIALPNYPVAPAISGGNSIVDVQWLSDHASAPR
jgi:prepilin-type processing-associated H-X9-DG protein